MNTEKIIMCVVALLIGMLVANMLTNVCGCKTGVEGFNYTHTDTLADTPGGTIDHIYGAGAESANFGQGLHGCGGHDNWDEKTCSDIFNAEAAQTACMSGLAIEASHYAELPNTNKCGGFAAAHSFELPSSADLCPLCGWKTCGKGDCYWRGPLGSDGLEPTTLPGLSPETAQVSGAAAGTHFKPCPNWNPNRNPAPDKNGACCPGTTEPNEAGDGCE